jgi:hypothetical protein
MLIWLFSQKQVTAADVMVMPRSFSCSIQSVVDAVVRFADLVVHTCVEQNALGGGGLPANNVGHDADVPDIRK